MTFAALLKKMRDEQKLGDEQAKLLLDLHEKCIFSLHRELRFLIYVGILLFIAGAGLTIRQYFVHLGDVAIISTLTCCCASALVYCFIKGKPFDADKVASPHIAFDYALFLSCAFFSMDIAYIETQFSILGDGWKNYLLLSVVLFFFLAYRFDNRLVLSMALSTLAAWFGFTLSARDWFSFAENYRLYAIAYGFLALAGGVLLDRLALKKHFFDVYLHFAIHFLCIALISGIVEYKIFSIYLPALIAVCGALASYAVRVHSFVYLLYATVYGYIGVSIVTVDCIHRQTFLIFAYFILSSLLVISIIFKMSRKYREEK